MQCPPSLSWHHPESFAQALPPADRTHQLHQVIANFISGSHLAIPKGESDLSLASLACIGSFLWPAVYPRQNRNGSNDVVVESISLWKGDLVELACESWLRSDDTIKDPSHLTVYHMINIMLHANLTVIQSFAHSTPDSAARDPEKGLAAREIHAWIESRHYKIAQWHAEHIIAGIEGALAAPAARQERSNLRQPSSHLASSSTEPRRLPYEAPHIPYAVYFATLIIWCGALIEEGATSTSSSARAPITRGERILSLHKVHIAQLLARVLSEVK